MALETLNSPIILQDWVFVKVAHPCTSVAGQDLTLIIIYVSTGRIQIQGKYLLEWGDSEFIALLNIVNAIRDGEISDEIQESSVNDLGKFIDLISTPKTLEIQENIEIENDGAN
jgi:hypothetical protein